ncbi:MFS transporter [Acidisphaera sp. S103]|uniref:MFS transporter n=1 Tax=Acidisphaera sp. S103 TaxID=1747223 RepID=UPI00131EA4BC|nr:MFS transporter [Acidisphaera sp. S103]
MENHRFGLTILATSIGFVLVQLDVSIINVALASIGAGLHTGTTGLQWVVDAYVLTFAALLLSTAALGDRIGPRRMFIAGLATFTAASVLCGLAPTPATLIVARILQGAGAAALVPCSLALLSRTCGNDLALRAWGVGWWTAAGSVGLAAGPLLGGLMVDTIGWRGIFLVNLPIGLAGILLTRRAVTPIPGTETKLDWPGQILAITSLLPLTAAVIEASTWSYLLILIATLSLTAFIATERRHAHPMLPLDFFRQRTFSGATAVGFLLNMTLYGCIFVLSLYFQQTRHWSAAASGIAFLPLPITLGIANILANRIGTKLGTPAAMTTGLLLAAIGTASLVGLDATTPYAWIIPGLTLIPAGIGITVPLMTAALLGSVPQPQSGVASGVLNAVRQAGGAIGVALFGSLALQHTFVLAATLLTTAAVIAAALIRTAKPAQQPAGKPTWPHPISRPHKEIPPCTRSPNPPSYTSARPSY